MPPFEAKGDDPLELRITVRFSKPEHTRLSQDATSAGLSISEIIRRRVFGRPITASVDVMTIRELRRIGGLIKLVHNQSAGAYSAQTAELLTQLSVAVTALGNAAIEHNKRQAQGDTP